MGILLFQLCSCCIMLRVVALLFILHGVALCVCVCGLCEIHMVAFHQLMVQYIGVPGIIE